MSIDRSAPAPLQAAQMRPSCARSDPGGGRFFASQTLKKHAYGHVLLGNFLLYTQQYASMKFLALRLEWAVGGGEMRPDAAGRRGRHPVEQLGCCFLDT